MKDLMRVNAQVFPYLTPKARTYFDLLAARGWDPDMAISLLEATLDEREIYVIPDDVEVDHERD